MATWRTESVNRQVFAAMMTVGGVTVVVKLAAMVKEVFTARAFGTSNALDAYLMAFLVPQFAIYLIGGTLGAALIPTYIEVRERDGRDAAQRLLSSVMVWTTAMLGVVTLILAGLADWVLASVASGFGPEKLAINHAEDRRVDANAQRQREDRHAGDQRLGSDVGSGPQCVGPFCAGGCCSADHLPVGGGTRSGLR